MNDVAVDEAMDMESVPCLRAAPPPSTSVTAPVHNMKMCFVEVFAAGSASGADASGRIPTVTLRGWLEADVHEDDSSDSSTESSASGASQDFAGLFPKASRRVLPCGAL